jgi:HEAT repeat protein
MLVLAGKCLRECTKSSEPIIYKILEEIYNFWYNHPEEKYIQSILAELGKLYFYIYDRLIETLHTAKNHKDEYYHFICTCLGKIGNNRCIEVLLNTLKEGSYGAIEAAGHSLSRIGNSEIVSELINIIKDDKLKERSRTTASVILGFLNDKKIEKDLISIFHAKNYSNITKDCAAASLEIIESYNSIKALMEVYDDDKEAKKRRDFWISELNNIYGQSSMIDLVIRVLKEDNKFLGKKIATSIRNIDCTKNVEILLNTLKDDQSFTRNCAALALRDIRNGESVSLIIRAIKRETTISQKLLSALSNVNNDNCLNRLIEAMKDENNLVRSSAARALGCIGKLEAENALINALKNDDLNVKIDALMALGNIKSYKSIKELAIALDDENYNVRAEAAQALGDIGSPICVEALTKKINDINYVRLFAVEALSKIGSKDCKKAMITALKDKDGLIKQYACETLEKIGTLDILLEIISSPDIDIYSSYIFGLSRNIATRFFKEKVDFIPVYQEVIERYKTLPRG